MAKGLLGYKDHNIEIGDPVEIKPVYRIYLPTPPGAKKIVGDIGEEHFGFVKRVEKAKR